MRVVAEMPNGSRIFFAQGKFDDWCVYLQRRNERPFAPLDVWYFSELALIDRSRGDQTVYRDFVEIYDGTGREISDSLVGCILSASRSYGEHEHHFGEMMCVIYAGMIAEENKRNTRLGKRVKRLGMHQTLVERMPPATAANFSRGMSWQKIDEECRRRGF